jgi:hypothetical protein
MINDHIKYERKKKPNHPFGDLVWAKITELENNIIDEITVSTIMKDISKTAIISQESKLDLDFDRKLLKLKGLCKYVIII